MTGCPDDPAADEGDWFRPVWADDDEPPPLPRARFSPARPPPSSFAGLDLAALIGPPAVAQDALARLDAKDRSGAPPIRVGLVARLAFREAAGWLAYAAAWVHPTDLSLRDAHLTGFGELANSPRGRRGGRPGRR